MTQRSTWGSPHEIIRTFAEVFIAVTILWQFSAVRDCLIDVRDAIAINEGLVTVADSLRDASEMIDEIRRSDGALRAEIEARFTRLESIVGGMGGG